jgi:hypothetical protein
MRFIPSVLSALLRQKNIREFAVELNTFKMYDQFLSVCTRKFVSKLNKPTRISEGNKHTRLVTTTRKHDFAILNYLSNRRFVLMLVLSATWTTCCPGGNLLFLIIERKILVYANAVNARNRSMFVTKNGRVIWQKCTPLKKVTPYRNACKQQTEIMYFNSLAMVTWTRWTKGYKTPIYL